MTTSSAEPLYGPQTIRELHTTYWRNHKAENDAYNKIVHIKGMIRSWAKYVDAIFSAYQPQVGHSVQTAFDRVFAYAVANFLGYFGPQNTNCRSEYQKNTSKFLIRQSRIILSDKNPAPVRRSIASAKLMRFIDRIANDQTHRITTDADYRERYEDLRFVAVCMSNYANNNELADLRIMIEKINKYIAPFVSNYEQARADWNLARANKIQCDNEFKIAKENLNVVSGLFSKMY